MNLDMYNTRTSRLRHGGGIISRCADRRRYLSEICYQAALIGSLLRDLYRVIFTRDKRR